MIPLATWGSKEWKIDGLGPPWDSACHWSSRKVEKEWTPREMELWKNGHWQWTWHDMLFTWSRTSKTGETPSGSNNDIRSHKEQARYSSWPSVFNTLLAHIEPKTWWSFCSGPSHFDTPLHIQARKPVLACGPCFHWPTSQIYLCICRWHAHIWWSLMQKHVIRYSFGIGHETDPNTWSETPHVVTKRWLQQLHSLLQ